MQAIQFNGSNIDEIVKTFKCECKTVDADTMILIKDGKKFVVPIDHWVIVEDDELDVFSDYDYQVFATGNFPELVVMPSRPDELLIPNDIGEFFGVGQAVWWNPTIYHRVPAIIVAYTDETGNFMGEEDYGFDFESEEDITYALMLPLDNKLRGDWVGTDFRVLSDKSPHKLVPMEKDHFLKEFEGIYQMVKCVQPNFLFEISRVEEGKPRPVLTRIK